MNWLFQNVRHRAGFALKNPRYALNSILRELTHADEKFLGLITGVPTQRIRAYLNEPINTPDFARHLADAEANFRGLSIESADLFAKKVLVQYAAMRALGPETIIETGVANGVSSSYLLLALKMQGKGRLHSIGLGDRAYLPTGKEAGWFVPEWLREQWQVHLGDARELLPPLLARVGTIDVFIHDSLHTYDHMFWEFETAYRYLRPGGLLISDDALWNEAFYDFSRKMGEPQARILRGVGFLRKDHG